MSTIFYLVAIALFISPTPIVAITISLSCVALDMLMYLCGRMTKDLVL